MNTFLPAASFSSSALIAQISQINLTQTNNADPLDPPVQLHFNQDF
jgi:hypothetical protein